MHQLDNKVFDIIDARCNHEERFYYYFTENIPFLYLKDYIKHERNLYVKLKIFNVKARGIYINS